MAAFEGLLMEVNRRNVFLERGMLSEGLVARRIFSTAVLVSSVMRSEVATKSGARHETLVATWAVTDIVSNG